jgi:phage terminase large subunit GpA-like protein
VTLVPIAPIDLTASRVRARRAAARALRSRLRLPPRISLSEWADRYRVLSPESSAEPGPWRTERVPYLREIMDTISGREYKDITIVKSSQTAGTEAINNAVGFYIDQEPSPMLVIQPNVKPMAEAWSKDRLAPMLRDCPRLKGKVRDPARAIRGTPCCTKSSPAATSP